MKDKFSFSCHFSSLGWLAEKDSCDIFWFPGRQLEAIKIAAGDLNISYSVLTNKENIWNAADEKGIAGTVGKKQPIFAIKGELSPEESEKYRIYYRVCLKNIGWTAFCSNGEVCGNGSGIEGCYIEGLQMLLISNEASLDFALMEAERSLEKYKMNMNGLYINNSEKMLDACTRDYCIKRKTEARIVKNGIILPLKKLPQSTRNGVFAGGVCDEKFQFITGMDRKNGKAVNLSCMESYVPKEEIQFKDETVIFGGIYNKVFGHLFSECLSRLWWVVENADAKEKVAILTIPDQKELAWDFFELLGIGDRVEIIDKPTIFSEVIVPDETMHLWSGYCDKYSSIFDAIRKKVIPMKDEKIYLTRTRFKDNDGINEEYFERFFEKRGFKVIAPEEHTIAEQVAIIAGAREIVCTEGTLSHLALFAHSGTKLTILRRTEDSILIPQLIINQARNLEVSYIDVSHNFLPVKHTGGVFLYGPTDYFINYLKDRQIEFTDDEVKFDLREYCYDYLIAWCEKYNEVKNFDAISKVDLFDFVERMNRVFGMNQISRSKYVTKVKEKEKKLQDENKKLKEQLNHR